MSRRLVLSLLAAALIAGCGGDDPATTSTTATESTDRAKLPADWSRQVNHDGGISAGVPFLWRAENRGTSIVVRSPDKLLAISISPDRTSEAVELPAEEFAAAVADSLPGYERLTSRPPKPFGHRYGAAVVEFRGRAADGPAQEGLIVVISRKELAKVTALAAWNEARTPAGDVRDARRILRTIRTEPVA